MRLKSASNAALAVALGLGAQACRAQRELIISSDPPGAQIRLDDTLLAVKTPAHVPFKDYGTRRVTLYLEGYVTYSQPVKVKPPWFGRFPLDIFSEIIFPIGWHDRHRLKVKMVAGDTRVASPDLVEVMQRAETLRRAGPDGPKVKQKPVLTLPREPAGAIEPVPPEPTPPPKPEPPSAGGGA
ncbi:MAG TPA: PEGA domain-containing protein [Planctomycetota bacterium]|nr:PEGA domain-containing protein [Planctomycetota bacterium]